MQCRHSSDGGQLLTPTVVTAFGAQGWATYGRGFIKSYRRHCPFPLIIYTEGFEFSADDAWIRPQLEIEGLAPFIARHQANEAFTGRALQECWSPKDRRLGYSFRTDAVKFCRMVFAIWDGARVIQDRPMIWLDGDTVVRQDVPEDFFERFVPEGAALSYLGRGDRHTETGFLALRLPAAMPIVEQWMRYYRDDTFQILPEWHSAYLFDRARDSLPEIPCHDLTPGGRGHVIHTSEVGSFFDHLKGERKTLGRSPEAKDLRGLRST